MRLDWLNWKKGWVSKEDRSKAREWMPSKCSGTEERFDRGDVELFCFSMSFFERAGLGIVPRPVSFLALYDILVWKMVCLEVTFRLTSCRSWIWSDLSSHRSHSIGDQPGPIENTRKKEWLRFEYKKFLLLRRDTIHCWSRRILPAPDLLPRNEMFFLQRNSKQKISTRPWIIHSQVSITPIIDKQMKLKYHKRRRQADPLSIWIREEGSYLF